MHETYLTRETLLKRMQQMSDQDAWEEFNQMYRGFIYTIINKMGVNEHDGDDLFQKSMMKIVKALPTFDYRQSQGKFRNWVYTIVRNTVCSYFRKLDTVQRNTSELSLNYESSVQLCELDVVIEQEWQKHVAALAFYNISQKVSAEMLDAFQSGTTNETVEATAQRLGISTSSVYVYRMRVKNALIEEINYLRSVLE